MANAQLSTNPWVVTAGDAEIGTIVFTGELKLREIIFTDYTSGTDNFVLQDRNARDIFSGNGNTDLSPVVSNKLGWIQGLKLVTLTAGKLLIYFD